MRDKRILLLIVIGFSALALYLFSFLANKTALSGSEKLTDNIRKKVIYDKNNNPKLVIPLTIDSATELALTNSLDIQIAKYDAYRSRTKLKKAESIFDTFLNSEADYTDDKGKLASTISDIQTRTKSFSIGLEKTFPSGSTIALDAEDSRTSSNLSTIALSPYYETSGSITLTQSVGKNFFGVSDRAGIKITKIDIENSEYSSLNDIENTIYDIQLAYWTLTLKEEVLKIRYEMLDEAEKLYKVYKDKYEQGLVEEVDIFAVQANLKRRENEILAAKLEKEIANNNLLFLLNQGNTGIQIQPLDSLNTTPIDKDSHQELKAAIANRRDYKILQNELKSSDIDLVVKKNSLWPEIDLEASFKKNGISKSETRAFRDMNEEDNSEVYLGISFKVPLENREARSELKEAKLYKEQLLLSLKRIERLILKDVYNKVTQVNNLKNQVELYYSIVELQNGKLQEELKRFNYGRSDSDIVIRYEEDLLSSKLNLAQALFQYRISLIDLDLSKNALLSKYWSNKI